VKPKFRQIQAIVEAGAQQLGGGKTVGKRRKKLLLNASNRGARKAEKQVHHVFSIF